MKIAYYHVDCFTENLFHGDPAAVCIMDEWLPDTTLQAMAKEHNLPATAFIVAGSDAYAVRWFGPDSEIELCGYGSDVTYLAVLESEQQVHNIQLDMRAFRQLHGRNLIITAPGDDLIYELKNDRVYISGKGLLYKQGMLTDTND